MPLSVSPSLSPSHPLRTYASSLPFRHPSRTVISSFLLVASFHLDRLLSLLCPFRLFALCIAFSHFLLPSTLLISLHFLLSCFLSFCVYLSSDRFLLPPFAWPSFTHSPFGLAFFFSCSLWLSFHPGSLPIAIVLDAPSLLRLGTRRLRTYVGMPFRLLLMLAYIAPACSKLTCD